MAIHLSKKQEYLSLRKQMAARLDALAQKKKWAGLSPEDRERLIDLMLEREEQTRSKDEAVHAESGQRRIDENRVKRLLGEIVLAKLEKDPGFFAQYLTAESVPEHERHLIHRYWPALWPDALGPVKKRSGEKHKIG